LTIGGLVRIAQYELADYWRKHFKRINGIDCGFCSKAQRGKCREKDLYGECPRAVKLESLYRVIEDGNGGSTELHELIADDKAIDLVARLEARFTLDGSFNLPISDIRDTLLTIPRTFTTIGN
jgi:hypothetical protein